MRNASTWIVLSTLAALAPLGCDDPDTHEFADEERPAAAPAPGVDSLALELHEDGAARPELLIAAVEADPDTTIYFARAEPDADGGVVVDVTIRGRDGGFDYGGLLTSGQATPLELYLALAGAEATAPEPLRLAHERQVEMMRPGDGAPRDLSAVLPGPQALLEDHLVTAKSTFTCLSWDNYQSYMATRFSGAPGRYELIDSAVGDNALYTGWYPHSQVDMVACNYESSDDPAYHDWLTARLCHIRGLGGVLTTNCGNSILDDGYYLRRVYGPIIEYRQYKVEIEMQNGASLTSFSGLVKRDG